MPRSKKTDSDSSFDISASPVAPSKAATAASAPDTKPKRGIKTVSEEKSAQAIDAPVSLAKAVRKYTANGVLLSREVSSAYKPVKITYQGLLAQNGATELYARTGIGPHWENAQEVAMTKTSQGFEGVAIAIASSTLNVCFRDAAYNWDNNSRENYIFSVSP